MTAKYLLPLMALGVMSVYAGERESFDFGWKFKYYGAGNPGPARASSTQGGHPAIHAIDGNLNTRWCASSGAEGQVFEVNTGFSEPIQDIIITWEKNSPGKVLAVYESNGQKIEHDVEAGSFWCSCLSLLGVGHEDEAVEQAEGRTVIHVCGRPVSSLQLTINGTDRANWASIREIQFVNREGKVVKPVILPKYPDEHPESPAFKAEGYKDVQLPHDWAIESPFLAAEPNETGKLPWNGMGWYRKSFEVPASFNAEEERYYLDFDGVMSNPKVYVNGSLAGEWAYGYSPFRVDITPYLKAGQENIIAVQASNHEASTRWYPGAGIYRHVWLEKVGPAHLAQWGVYATTPEVTAESATVKVETTVENTGHRPVELTVHQAIGEAKASPVTVTLAPGATQTVTQQLKLAKPELWSCENPHLYGLETSVFEGEREVDGKLTNIGVRTIEWKADGFYLNGKRVELNGVCEHHDLGPLGSAFYERGFERKIEILKAMGCNSIRTTHNTPASELLDLCDRHGMLVIDEVFDIWKHQKYDKVNGYHKLWPQWWKKDVRAIAMRDRNHPCIIAWSGGNEITEITMKVGPAISRGIRDEFRRYDSTRPYTVGVNAASGAYNGFAPSMDVYGYNYKPDHYRDFEKKHQPGMPYYGSETASCVGTRDTYFFPVKWGVGDGFRNFQVSAYGIYAPGWAYSPDVEFTAQDANPNCAGEYVWTGFDYIGEPTPYNQDQTNANNFENEAERKKYMELLKVMGNKAPSRSSYFGIIDLAGFPKDTYYLYQSRWRPELAQAHILPHWNWAGREGEVTPVMVFSSGDEAELFLNGKSQGVRRKGEGGSYKQHNVEVCKNGYRFVWEDVKYEPGELRVVVKKGGKPWAEATRVTTGKTTQLAASADRQTIAGDGRDLSYISVSTCDAKGNVVPTDCRKVTFSISGPAELIGFCNGNPTDQRCMQDPQQAFFNGRIVAVVRGKRGESGEAVVTIHPEGLEPIRVPVAVQPATPEQLRQ